MPQSSPQGCTIRLSLCRGQLTSESVPLLREGEILSCSGTNGAHISCNTPEILTRCSTRQRTHAIKLTERMLVAYSDLNSAESLATESADTKSVRKGGVQQYLLCGCGFLTVALYFKTSILNVRLLVSCRSPTRY